MSDDGDLLVEKDELSNHKINGMLINVAPFHGLENIGFEDEVSEGDANDKQSLRNKGSAARATSGHREEHDFIMALFVVVFDTKHGMLSAPLHDTFLM